MGWSYMVGGGHGEDGGRWGEVSPYFSLSFFASFLLIFECLGLII
jgi:hypothetical protein